MTDIRYRPGNWIGVARSGMVALVPADSPQDLLDRIWETFGDSPGIDAALPVVSGGFGAGLAAMPHFGLVSVGRKLHVILRGPLEVAADGSGTAAVSGEHVTTWSERVLFEQDSFQLRVAGMADHGSAESGGAFDGGSPALRLVAGSVLASSLSVTGILSGGVPVGGGGAQAAGAAAPAVSPPADSAPARDVSASAEVNARRDVSADTLALADSEGGFDLDPADGSTIDPAAAGHDGADTEGAEADDCDHTLMRGPQDGSGPGSAAGSAAAGPSQLGVDAVAAAYAASVSRPASGPVPLPSRPASPPAVPPPAVPQPAAAPRQAHPDAKSSELIDSVPWLRSSHSQGQTPEPQRPLPAPADESASSAQQLGDHDGQTVMRSELPAPPPGAPATGTAPDSTPGPGGVPAQAVPPSSESRQGMPETRPGTGPMVLARTCGQGHANPPTSATCASCGQALSGDAQPVRRPSLGTMRVSTGELVDLDRNLIVGRQPSVSRVQGNDMPRLVQVRSENGDISRSHLEVRLEGWHVTLRDLKATNGTVLIREGQLPRRLGQGEAAILLDGDIADLGDGISLRFEDLR